MIIKRVKAFFIDIFILSLIISPASICVAFNLSELRENGLLEVVGYLTTYPFVFLYFFISEYFYLRTFGKRIMKLKVIELETSRNRFLTIFLRTIFRFVPLDFLSFIFSIENNFWHDLVSKTRVVENE